MSTEIAIDDSGNGVQAMTEEVYADNMQKKGGNKDSKKSGGVWGAVTSCFGSFWSTRQTIDPEDNDALIKTTLRELVIYIVFLITLCVITFDMTSSQHYYYTKVMQELFLDTKTGGSNTFRGINNIDQFWEYIDSNTWAGGNIDEVNGNYAPLLEGVYWEKWYNGDNVTVGEENFIFYENKLLGIPRLRQLRVKEGVCQVHEDFADEIDNCYDRYSTPNQDTAPFGDKNSEAFKFQDEETLDGSSHWSKLRVNYDGAGYVQDLGLTKYESQLRIDKLRKNRWIDHQTRVVFIDFTVYNANINLFCVVRLVAEFPETGGLIPSWTFNTVEMTRGTKGYDKFLLALEYFYMVMICYYVVEEILEIRIHKMAYFKGFWNILDIVIILFSIVACAFRIYQSKNVTGLLSLVHQSGEKFADFEKIAWWTVQYQLMIALTVFIAWIKLFKYISFNRTMTQLQQTLSRCAADIAGFAVMFFIIFVAYAQLGYLIFGTIVSDFNSFHESMFTLFRIVLGDFNFHELEEANRVMGPIFFMTYVFLVFFVLLNMFLAIINDTYSEVKADIALQQSEVQVGDYLKRGYNKMLTKLKMKQEHLKDIQDALATADINNDKALDWEEWRNDLRARGIPDNEIEAVFAKYDTDGDMVLNEDEQKALARDLEQSRRDIDEKMGKIDKSSSDAVKDANKVAMPIGGVGAMVGGEDDENLLDGAGGEEILDRLGKHFVGHEEFELLTKRINRLERSVGNVVGKIDAIIVKLDASDRVRNRNKTPTLGKRPVSRGSVAPSEN